MENDVALLFVNFRTFAIIVLATAINNRVLEPDSPEFTIAKVGTVLHGMSDREAEIWINPLLPRKND